MTLPAVVFLDIGETLVHGPPEGPARRIARTVGLSAGERRALHDALMTRPFATPAAVSAWMAESLGIVGAEAAVGAVWAAQERDARPVDGAESALRALHEDGVTLGLLSNIWQPYLSSAWLGLGDLLEQLVAPALRIYSFREGHAKPAPAIFARALAAAGVPAERTVMVGDSYAKDIAPAARAGMGTVHVGGPGGVESVAALDGDVLAAAVAEGARAHPVG